MNRRRIPSRVFSVLVYVFLYAPILLLIVCAVLAIKVRKLEKKLK